MSNPVPLLLTVNASESTIPLDERAEDSRGEFLDDLCPQVRPLVARLMDCDCGCEILEFFRHRPLTSLEARDIAYHTRLSLAQVIAALKMLADARVIECSKILNFTFYGLTSDSETQGALEQFWVWRDYWRAHLEHVRHRLQLDALFLSSGMPTTR